MPKYIVWKAKDGLKLQSPREGDKVTVEYRPNRILALEELFYKWRMHDALKLPDPK